MLETNKTTAIVKGFHDATASSKDLDRGPKTGHCRHQEKKNQWSLTKSASGDVDMRWPALPGLMGPETAIGHDAMFDVSPCLDPSSVRPRSIAPISLSRPTDLDWTTNLSVGEASLVPDLGTPTASGTESRLYDYITEHGRTFPQFSLKFPPIFSFFLTKIFFIILIISGEIILFPNYDRTG